MHLHGGSVMIWILAKMFLQNKPHLAQSARAWLRFATRTSVRHALARRFCDDLGYCKKMFLQNKAPSGKNCGGIALHCEKNSCEIACTFPVQSAKAWLTRRCSVIPLRSHGQFGTPHFRLMPRFRPPRPSLRRAILPVLCVRLAFACIDFLCRSPTRDACTGHPSPCVSHCALCETARVIIPPDARVSSALDLPCAARFCNVPSDLTACFHAARGFECTARTLHDACCNAFFAA